MNSADRPYISQARKQVLIIEPELPYRRYRQQYDKYGEKNVLAPFFPDEFAHLLIYPLRANLVQGLMQQPGKLRHDYCPARCFLTKPASEPPPAKLLGHPVFQIWFGG